MNLKQIPQVLDSKISCLRIRVPENLDLALEGLIRKVLREQPKTDDIYSFAANYFETLLKIRDKAGTKLTGSQLCPFHNDEDAHEMIKIAGTFKKPKKTNEEFAEVQKKKGTETQQKKQTVKEKKILNRPTPDLIKKLPKKTKTQPTNEKEEEKAEVENEEFLTSDPIKELVEKELLMETKSSEKEEETSEQKSAEEKNLKTETKTEKNKPSDDKKNELLLEETPMKEGEESHKIETEYQEINKEQENTLNLFENTMKDSKEIGETPEETVKKEEIISEKEAEALQTLSEEVNKEKINEDEVEDKKQTDENEGENAVVETSKVENQIQTLEHEEDKKEEETKQKTQDEENKKTETLKETEKLPESPKETSKDEIIPKEFEGEKILTSEVQQTKNDELPTENEIKEEKIKATGEQQQETEIDKETKATDENTAKTEEETLPVGENSFVTNSPEDHEHLTENEKQEKKKEETVKNEEKIIPNEILKEQKTNSQNLSQNEEENEVTEEVKETILGESENQQNIHKNEETLVMDTENKNKKEENVNEDAKICLEKSNDKTEDAKSDETLEANETTIKAESQTSLDEKPTEEEITNQGGKTIEENQESKTSGLEQVPDALKTIEKESEEKNHEENQTEENLEDFNNKTPPTPKKTQETVEIQEGKENIDQSATKPLTESQNAPADDGRLNEEQKPSENDNNKEEELCTVADGQNTQRKYETETQTQEEIHLEVDPSQEDKKTEPEELCRTVDVQNIREEKAEDGILRPEAEIPQSKDDKINPEELCAVVDVEHIPKEETKPEVETIQNVAEVEPPHIVEPEKMQNPEVSSSSDEVQIKTIQTHYYDTLQVPETVTKEYIVHDLSTPSVTTLMSVANSLHQNYKQTQNQMEETISDENMNAPPPTEFLENITVLPPSDATTDVLQPEDHLRSIQTEADALNLQETESNIQITDSDDLLDIMTPTSGYSLNLSEISWQTVNGVFLDSERRYSSLEKEEIRYTTPKSDDQNIQEVEEVIHKTVIPTGIEAVPVPPEEINEEANMETEKEKKEEKGEGEPEGSFDSTNGKSADGDIPFISVEVKTVIETQMLDEEDVEEDGEQKRRPGVEVKVEATIDIQDDVEVPQSEPDLTEEGNKISKGKIQEIGGLKSSLEDEKIKSQEEERKESFSTGKEGSSGESDTTISSAATEIKRTDSGKRNFSSTRSLLSTQSLDLGKRNPLVKTRSLSTFRHGVTDFEVWNTIEKELEEAATKIQSKFRGYKTRKKLQRENAVQITTEESSITTTPVEVETEAEEIETKDEGQQSTGEFHDSIVLAEHPR